MIEMPRRFSMGESMHFLYDFGRFPYSVGLARRVVFMSSNIQVIKKLFECDLNLVLAPNVVIGEHNIDEIYQNRIFNYVHNIQLRTEPKSKAPLGLHYEPLFKDGEAPDEEDLLRRMTLAEKGFALEAIYGDIVRMQKYTYTNDYQEMVYQLKYEEAKKWDESKDKTVDPLDYPFLYDESKIKNISMEMLVKSILLAREIFVDKMANVENVRLEFTNKVRDANHWKELPIIFDEYWTRTQLSAANL